MTHQNSVGGAGAAATGAVVTLLPAADVATGGQDIIAVGLGTSASLPLGSAFGCTFDRLAMRAIEPPSEAAIDGAALRAARVVAS